MSSQDSQHGGVPLMIIDLHEEKCLNPNCHYTINRRRVPKNIFYCGKCQNRLNELGDLFISGEENILIELFHSGKLSRPKASKLLGIPLETLRDYCRRGVIRDRKEGRYCMIDINDLISFRQYLVKLVSLEEMAKLVGISKFRLDYLDKQGYYKAKISPGGHKVYRKSDTKKIRREHLRVKALEKHRRSKAHKVNLLRYQYNIHDVARILEYERLENLRKRIRKNQLKAIKTGKGFIITRFQLISFCRKIVKKELYIQKPEIKKAAQKYLDSIAAG